MRVFAFKSTGGPLQTAAFCAAFLRCACLILLLGVTKLYAEPVTIRAGGLELQGDVLGFDGTFLRLETEAGEVTLDLTDATCEGADCPQLDTYVPVLRLSGSGRMADLLLPALIDGYARNSAMIATREATQAGRFAYTLADRASGAVQLRFDFRVGTSDQGFADLIENRADAVLSVREIRETELRAAQAAGLGRLKEPGLSRIVALDALVPIVSPRRPVPHLSLPQLAQMLQGEITDWSQLGLAPGPVSLHLLDAETGFAQGVADLFEEEGALAGTVTRHPDARSLAAAVAADAGALGIVPFASHDNAVPVALGGGCGLLSAADRIGLKTEDYPLTRPLFLYLPQRRVHPRIEAWLAWLRTAEAQRIIQRAGFVDRAATPIPIADQGDRIAHAVQIIGAEIALDDVQQMLEALLGRVRLSTTFRFEPGSTRLDAQSRSNMLHLARRLRDGDFTGAKLYLVGFSDGAGPAAANRTLSRARAETVRWALSRALGGVLPQDVTIELNAYGESLPLACDDDEWGRQSNRRVELWIERP